MSNPHSAEVKEPTFEGLSIKDGLMEMKIGNAEQFIKDVGLRMVDILESVEATNYVSFEIPKSKIGPLELILQKTKGKTAHTLRLEAESEKQRLQADLDRHKDLLRKQCNRSQELQTLLDEAVTLLGDYRNVCGIKQRDKLREFLERVKK